MDMRGAFDDTMALARARNMLGAETVAAMRNVRTPDELSYAHLMGHGAASDSGLLGGKAGALARLGSGRSGGFWSGYSGRDERDQQEASVTCKHVIFLDVDGVLASSRVHFGHGSSEDLIWSKFDPVALDFLNWIWSETRAEVVFTSAWKEDVDTAAARMWVIAAMRNGGFFGRFHNDWKTDYDYSGPDGRPGSVKKWLGEHPEVVDYIIFDDSSYRFNEVLGRKRFVRTDPEDGMLSKHMKRAEQLISNWEK